VNSNATTVTTKMNYLNRSPLQTVRVSYLHSKSG